MAQAPVSQPADSPVRSFAMLTSLLVVAISLGGCVQTKQFSAGTDSAGHPQPEVLLMPPDVLLLEVSTAGVPLPKADWTREAEAALATVLQETAAASSGRMQRYTGPPDTVLPYHPAHLPAIHLHEAVLQTILTYRYAAGQGAPRLTSKDEQTLDWTLGQSVRALREDTGADYALFVIYRQATSTAGRALMTTAGFLLFGAIAPTSQTLGLASLVDLHSGRLVWTNVLQGEGFDASKPNDLHGRYRKLLEGIPL